MSTRFPKLLITLTVALAAMVARPTTAQAQEHADLVWKQMQTAFTTVAKDGYGSRNYIIGRMNDDINDSWTLNFEKGMTYKIYGACDRDCKDLDIEVLDGSDVIVKDILVDDQPVVTFQPKTSGSLRVKVTMVDCSDNPCFFGFAIFQK
jgi:hypothetical protein